MNAIKKKLSIVLGLLMALAITMNAQNFEGIATYQTARKMNNFNIKGEGITPQMQEQLKQKMKKQFQREYELKFNLKESLWKEVESLEGGPATAQAGGMMITMSAGGGVTYKNTAENLYMREADVFGKPFLVSDELVQREWEMTQETKKIGDYTAYKAIYTNISESRSFSFSTEGDDEDGNETITMDTTQIEAWYTPQIPVSQGPEDFAGLPGLILELNDGTTSYVCTKVVTNPEDGVDIKRPSKGRKVTRAELREETEAKTQEMMKKFNQGGKGSRTFTISTGGGE